jgi:hypothetical protein
LAWESERREERMVKAETRVKELEDIKDDLEE